MLDSTEAMHDVAMAQAMVAAWSAELLLAAGEPDALGEREDSAGAGR